MQTRILAQVLVLDSLPQGQGGPILMLSNDIWVQVIGGARKQTQGYALSNIPSFRLSCVRRTNRVNPGTSHRVESTSDDALIVVRYQVALDSALPLLVVVPSEHRNMGEAPDICVG